MEVLILPSYIHLYLHRNLHLWIVLVLCVYISRKGHERVMLGYLEAINEL
jgi:hypothetical protein